MGDELFCKKMGVKEKRFLCRGSVAKEYHHRPCVPRRISVAHSLSDDNSTTDDDKTSSF